GGGAVAGVGRHFVGIGPQNSPDPVEQRRQLRLAASILDFTDEITRKTLPSLGPALETAASNVFKLAKR
ncbi:hypothetical protein, partial [Bradyrhizobium sp. sBnM-33]|uniref:hypothetical protein n=1 Tax=Bradyrhizobium sp. sBnM-33 TaxID=2831780 RepID=UPI001BCE8B40